jgi:hypothetical protein
MKRAIRLAVLASVVAPMAACASPHDGQGAGSATLISGSGKSGKTMPPAMSSPISPESGGPPAAMSPNQASPDPRAIDLRPARFDQAREGAGRELIVHYTITGKPQCNVLGQVRVAETATEVRVTLMLGRQPGADCTGPQPQLAAPVMTVVTLSEPLGARQIRDGS